jgi:MFS family permease
VDEAPLARGRRAGAVPRGRGRGGRSLTSGRFGLRLPDLLATRAGRLLAFFLLYVTEGIPSGFTVTAVATHLRRGGVPPEAIGGYIAALYLPWAFKWAVGPFVDTISSDRHGRYRTWILITQFGLVAALLAATPLDLAHQLPLFTALLVVHNVFGATQDVAIDALAVNVLREDERGLANGFMFGGQSVGIALGGGGVLLLTRFMPFESTFLVVAAAILVITLGVALPMKEPPGPPRPPRDGGTVRAIGRELSAFVHDSWRAFTGSTGAKTAVLFALLPTGAYALSLSLQSNLAVELGFDDTRVGQLSLISTFVGAAGCVVGGWLSDRLGRRRMLALYIVGMSIPTLALAFAMQNAGWIHPLDAAMTARPVPPASLVATFWWMTILYQWMNGLMYGASIALYMDVTTPRVAATQFTAYMAIANGCTAYSAWWQGHAAARLGYPMTLVIDGIVGLVGIGLLPWIRPVRPVGLSTDR